MAKTRAKINLSSLSTTKTIGEAAEEFYAHNKSKGLAAPTQKSYYYIINSFVVALGEEEPARRVCPLVMDKYTELLREQGLKSSSIETNLKHLRAFFNFCAKRDYMAPIELDIPKPEETIKEPYTEEEMRILLKRPRNDIWTDWRTWAMINYCFSTGQRLATVRALRVYDINFQEKKVFLRHNKDKIQKYMPLSSALIAVLREYIELSELEEDDYLFPEKNKGGQLSACSAEDCVRRYNRARGVEKTSIHLFRHTFAKQYIVNGGNPAKLQKLLNHKTMDMTMRYVALYGDELTQEFDVFNPLDNLQKRRRK